MATIRVNLHPAYSYSNVIIQNGYIAELKEYVKLVDWLSWDFVSVKGNPIICIHGGFDDIAKDKHIERTHVFLQRIKDNGKHDVFVRDERWDDWQEYFPTKTYTPKEIYDIEKQRIRKDERLEWVLQDIEKYENMLEMDEKGFIKGLLEERRKDLCKYEQEEFDRCRNIQKIWDR